MKKYERSFMFYSLIDNLIPYMDEDLQRKMEFAKDYMNNMTIKDLENKRISLGPMDEKTLQLLIFSILLEYDSLKEPGKLKKIKKHRFYLDTEEIFSNREMTPEDVVFIEFIFAKLRIDLESETHEEFIMSTNQILFLVRGIMREYNLFLGSSEKFEE